MAYQFDITVCIDIESPTKHFAGTYVGLTPEAVTSVAEVPGPTSTVYVMAFRIVDSKGRSIQYNAFYTSTDKIYFSLNGYDLRAYSFPLTYTIFRSATNILVSGTISNCGEEEDDGSTGGGGSGGSGGGGSTGGADRLTPSPQPPSDPCLPSQPQATPPVVATPCDSATGTPGQPGFGASPN